MRAHRTSPGRPPGTPAGTERRRPVMLVTIESAFDADAERLAVDAALEAGAPLVLVELIDIACLASVGSMGGCRSLAPVEEQEALRRTARDAAGFGIAVTLLHVRSPRPARALGELVSEHRPALLILGPRRMPRGRLGRALTEAARSRDDCLVWVAG